MKIVVAPTSFKGTLGVIDASIAIIRGIRQIDAHADIVQFPVSDGGDSFLEAALFNCGGKYIDTVVTGPRGKKQTVVCGVLSGGSGIVEMAKASGFALLEETERNPLLTSSYGTGELILSLIKRGVH
ncbi:MAG: hypothetical protein E3J78_08090 [Candidatus Cloacimonadota bacterium]|nr:MAG: hypothetical protein E3J78_08090 [Candidatus Cloacimonadota bacterium]